MVLILPDSNRSGINPGALHLAAHREEVFPDPMFADLFPSGRGRPSVPFASYRQHRPMVERSLAWLTRGNRKLRYRGTAKNNAWLHLRAGAINLRRLTTLGLQRTDGAWTIT